jgi:hypothetical protein
LLPESTEAFQAKLTLVDDFDGLLRPAGIDGAVVSGGGGLALFTVTLMVVVLELAGLALSAAVAIKV